MKQKKTIVSKLADILILFTSFFSIFMLLFVIIKALTYWSFAVKDIVNLNAKMFWIGLLIAILYSCFNVIGGFIKEIVAVAKNFTKWISN